MREIQYLPRVGKSSGTKTEFVVAMIIRAGISYDAMVTEIFHRISRLQRAFSTACFITRDRTPNGKRVSAIEITLSGSNAETITSQLGSLRKPSRKEISFHIRQRFAIRSLSS